MFNYNKYVFGKLVYNLSLPAAVSVCFVLFCKLFWTQACPEEKGTNGTHRSHARCHPYPIPKSVEVGHTTGVYVPYSFRTVVWVLLRPTVFHPYPRRLES